MLPTSPAASPIKGGAASHIDTGDYDDLLEEGILDPATVTCLALQNAASVAGLLLMTEVMIAEAPKDYEHAHGGGARGVMGGMVCKEPEGSSLPDD